MPVIAICGQPTSGSSTVAKLLAKNLKLKHFSAGDFYKKQAQKFINEKETSQRRLWRQHTVTNPLTQSTADFLRHKVGGSVEFHEKLDAEQVRIAKKGDVVIESKLAVHMLKGIADFSVWLKCKKTERARRVAKRENLTKTESMKILDEREAAERSTFQRIYGFDTFDQEREASLTIDTSKKKPEQIVNEIISALRNKSLM